MTTCFLTRNAARKYKKGIETWNGSPTHKLQDAGKGKKYRWVVKNVAATVNSPVKVYVSA